MAKGSLAEQFGPILGKAAKTDPEVKTSEDIIAAIKDGDAESLRSALKLFLEQCGAYTKDSGDDEEEEEAEEGE